MSRDLPAWPVLVERVHVLRLTSAEVAILTSVLVDTSDELVKEFPLLTGQAYREAHRTRDILESVISRLMDLKG